MTAAWICQRANGEKSAHDTEGQAESEAAYLVGSKTATNAVWYLVEVEPVVRVGYWERVGEAAA